MRALLRLRGGAAERRLGRPHAGGLRGLAAAFAEPNRLCRAGAARPAIESAGRDPARHRPERRRDGADPRRLPHASGRRRPAEAAERNARTRLHRRSGHAQGRGSVRGRKAGSSTKVRPPKSLPPRKRQRRKWLPRRSPPKRSPPRRLLPRQPRKERQPRRSPPRRSPPRRTAGQKAAEEKAGADKVAAEKAAAAKAMADKAAADQAAAGEAAAKKALAEKVAVDQAKAEPESTAAKAVRPPPEDEHPRQDVVPTPAEAAYAHSAWESRTTSSTACSSARSSSAWAAWCSCRSAGAEPRPPGRSAHRDAHVCHEAAAGQAGQRLIAPSWTAWSRPYWPN